MKSLWHLQCKAQDIFKNFNIFYIFLDFLNFLLEMHGEKSLHFFIHSRVYEGFILRSILPFFLYKTIMTERFFAFNEQEKIALYVPYRACFVAIAKLSYRLITFSRRIDIKIQNYDFIKNCFNDFDHIVIQM